MVIVLSLILTNVMDSFGNAFFLSVMLLPGILFVKYFSKGLSFKRSKSGLLHGLYFIGAAVAIEFLCISLVCWFLYAYGQLPEKTGIAFSPIFICFILVALLSIESLLKLKFFSTASEEKYISFTSQRIKISLEIDAITYIESKNEEVSVMTVMGKSYPTKMKISQWESVLDNRFIRIHRSFIVNRKQITRYDSRAVYFGEQSIEFSRKYKEAALNKLGA